MIIGKISAPLAFTGCSEGFLPRVGGLQRPAQKQALSFACGSVERTREPPEHLQW